MQTRMVFLHLIILVLLMYILDLLDIIKIFPLGDNLLKWDATWYNSIKLNDYSYSEKIQSNSGFFPLFPFVWKVLHLSAVQISLVNALLAILSLSVLASTFQIDGLRFLLLLSLPSCFFLYVPYAESVFFCCCTILLVGYTKNNPYMVVAGLALAATTKATALFFIPSIVFTELVFQNKSSFCYVRFFKNILCYSFAVLLGISAVVLLQFYKTGVWFAYFKAQSVHWNRSFSIPHFPLTTWDASRILALDSVAFVIGLVALLVSVNLAKNWFSASFSDSVNRSKSLLFSTSYLACVLGSILFFNPIDRETNTTSILSINRYVFTAPFLIVLLEYLCVSLKKQVIKPTVVVSFVMLCSMFFGAYHSIKIFFLFMLLSLFCYLWLMAYSKKQFYFTGIVLYFITLVLQILLLNAFIANKWVG